MMVVIKEGKAVDDCFRFLPAVAAARPITNRINYFGKRKKTLIEKIKRLFV